jgi:hypothetical protein
MNNVRKQIQTTLNENHLFLKAALASIIILFISTFLYKSFAHTFIQTIYEGRSLSILNKLVSAGASNPLDEYFKISDNLFSIYSIYLYCAAIILTAISLIKNKSHQAIVFVLLFAIMSGVYSQIESFINPYLTNDDACQHIWWMYQWNDPQLFQNDLLATYAFGLQHWGSLIIYRLGSIFVDPLLLGKTLGLLLFIMSAFFMYKLIYHQTKSYLTGILASVLFCTAPIFISKMVGGLGRAFGFPVMIMFFYFFLKRNYKASMIILIIQVITYPIALVLSVLTWMCSLVHSREKGKLKFFIIGLLCALSILTIKFKFFKNPDIGGAVSRQQMEGNPEFYNEARWPVIPTPNLFIQAKKDLSAGLFPFRVLRRNPPIQNILFFGLILCMFGLIIKQRRLFFPIEFVFLLVCCGIIYKLADIYLLKLYSPSRYFMYSLPFIFLSIICLFVHQLTLNIKKEKLRNACFIILIVISSCFFHIHKNATLVDFSKNKIWYDFINTLPKDAVIASHPHLADGIPLFAKRTVFLNWELSVPLFDKYWNTTKKRTYNFFDAYYSDDPNKIFTFCKQNNIDYLLVDRRHFSKDYINSGNIYFEPFQTKIFTDIKDQENFALMHVKAEEALFKFNNQFIIHRDNLKNND